MSGRGGTDGGAPDDSAAPDLTTSPPDVAVEVPPADDDAGLSASD